MHYTLFRKVSYCIPSLCLIIPKKPHARDGPASLCGDPVHRVLPHEVAVARTGGLEPHVGKAVDGVVDIAVVGDGAVERSVVHVVQGELIYLKVLIRR